MPEEFQNVLLFPGQGAYRDGALVELAERASQIGDVFETIDAVAARLGAEPPGARLLSTDPPSLESLLARSPDVLQLAIFGTSLALWRILEDKGLPVSAMVGHSSGEIAALVAAGAFTLADGTEIVIRRSALLRSLDGRDGRMVALACDAERAWRLIDAVDDPWTVVAVENGAGQTIVSGPGDSLTALASVARAVRVAATELKAAYPFHGPMLAPLVAEFAAQIRHLQAQPLTSLVYSPILGRFHRQGDALGEHIAQSLVAPVRFGTALRRLYESGARSFVDCSTAGGLARLVGRCLPDVSTMSALEAEAMGVAPASPAVARPVAVAAAVPAPAPLLTVVPEPVTAPTPGPSTRQDLFQELTTMYAEALEYPQEVFTEDVALEADLGIDSVKQTELLARAAEHYGLPERPEGFRLGDYETMGKLVDYLWSTRPAPAPDQPVPAAPDAPAMADLAVAPQSGPEPSTREDLFQELTTMYAEALEYPQEVFTEDVALEADLGIDSVKQTELLARAAEHYGLPERPEGFRLGDYETMGKLVDYLWSSQRTHVAYGVERVAV